MPQKSDQSDTATPVATTTQQPDTITIQNDTPKTAIQNSVPPALDTKPGDSSQIPKKYGGRKIIATIFGIGILMIGLTSTIFLVQRQQLLTGQAADCSEYTFSVTRDGTVTVRNESSQNRVSQKADVFINGLLVETYEIPALTGGNAETLGTVRVPMYDGFTWMVEGRSECKNNGRFEDRAN